MWWILAIWGSVYTLIGMFVSAKEFAEQQKYGDHPDITEAIIGCVFWPAIVVFWAVKWLSVVVFWAVKWLSVYF